MDYAEYYIRLLHMTWRKCDNITLRLLMFGTFSMYESPSKLKTPSEEFKVALF